MQGWDRQPWQLSVMRICLGGQALQAKGMILTRGSSKYRLSVAASSMLAETGICSAARCRFMPRASRTRSWTMARSRNTSWR